MKKGTFRYKITGKVQGVWFRASTKERAEELGISGTAQNMKDGTVEVYASGNIDQLEKFQEWLAIGPPKAEVDAVRSPLTSHL
jgi:acylphosphatase